ncbi:MAG TPA: murein L,D-transpeptidase catalytic domain family protein [Longimicrobiales bacterium]|nr:murein L,D-transpeptidase catalytic domain family protein [Longimicrobiales bacterium]
MAAAPIRPRSALAAFVLPILLLTGAAPPDTERAVADPEDEVATAVEVALDRLAPGVVASSHDDALEMAFRAYFRHRAEHPDEVKKPYLYYVDFGLSNQTPRGYVFDMDDLTVVDGPFTVSHGVGSSNGRNGVPVRFSNRPGSKMTSLGLYLAQETYTFRGRSGGRAYSSVGLRMRGESGEFNDAARRRGIVAHGAPYVTAGDAGRSEGCPAMEQDRARRLLPMIADGGMVFIFSPRDRQWLERDPWAGEVATGERLAGRPADEG